MKQLIFLTIKICLFLVVAISQSQSFKVKVVDEKTGTPISFATVKTGQDSGVITNDEGIFILKESQINKLKDSLYISYMGYETKGVLIKDITEGVIKLREKTFELKGVFLNSKNYSANEIIDLVKANMKTNYNLNLSKDKIFFRQSDIHTLQKMDVDFGKSSIEELNKHLIDSIINIIPEKFEFYREAVGDLYGDYNQHKLYVDKGAVLYNKNADVSMDGILSKIEGIFKDHVKPNSYLKIKSGWFSTKIGLDTLLNSEGYSRLKIENTENQIFQHRVRDSIAELHKQLFLNENAKLDVFRKSSRYKFEKHDYTFIDDEVVYVIKFSPKRGKDFEGIMYINAADFAVIRIDFNNIKALRTFDLFGFHYHHNIFRGKILFHKPTKNTYSLKYMELETGSDFGAERPLKIIEKNKYVRGRRKQNELALDIEFKIKSYHKYELIVYESKDILSTSYRNALENPEMKAEYLSQYNSDFWLGYNIIEPNKAIQSFKGIE